MPKLKTRRAVKKRIKVTGSGRFMRMQSGKSHILTKKRRKRKKRLSKWKPVNGSWDPKIRSALPYSG